MRSPARLTQYALRLACCALAAFLAACSLAEDITPPPGVEAGIRPTATVVIEPSFPAGAPSIAAGAALYQENCIRCHGVGGAGDGELAPQLQFKPANLADPAVAAATTPQRWYSIITNGNLERLMPPWGKTLTAAQRWHLVAYLYSLSAPEASVEAGQAVYEANCAACHGQTGAGDGPEAESRLPSFADQEYMAAKANQEFFDSLSRPGHNFTGTLSEAELQSAVDYVRALAFNRELPELTQGAVTGRLTNGTTGQPLPQGLTVELRLFDNFEPAGIVTTTLQSDGTFIFPDIDLVAGRALIVTAEYGGVLYSSDVSQITPDQASYDMPITVYETTADASAIRVDRMHVVFELNDGAVQVGELYVLSNTGDKTVRADTEGGPTVSFGLPPNAAALTFQDGAIGDRYVLTDSGFADTLPLGPGGGIRQILVSYKLAYNGSLSFSKPITLPTQSLNILLPGADLTLSGPNIVDGGVQTISNSQFRLYTATNLQPGDTLAFELRGGAAPVIAGLPAFDWRNTLIGGLALALAVTVAAYWWVDRRETGAKARTAAPRNLAARSEELLAEIADLDEGFEQGEYPESDYRREREKLKQELKKLLAQEKRPPKSRG